MAVNSKEDLLTLVRDFLHDPHQDRYTDDILYTVMQEALDEIATETTFFRRDITYFSALNSSGKYPLPDNLVSLLEVYYNYCEVPILNELCPCRKCPTSTQPSKVFVDTNNRDSFTFYPIPVSENTDTDDTALGAIIVTDEECIDVADSLSALGYIDTSREPQGTEQAVITLGYAYRLTLDDVEVWRNKDVVKAIRHYTLYNIWLQDKEGIDIALSDREKQEFEKILNKLNIRRVRDFAEPLYDLTNYKNIWKR